jgi:glutamyl-tRNA synthetase
MSITRLAPSPTGALHLGNARTFLINWILARQNGWEVLLRIEDLDGPRVKTGADKGILEDLRWLGLDWDAGPIYQSNRTAIYQSVIHYLLEKGLAYPCVCSRKEVELAASAPHGQDGMTVYPGTCRGKYKSMEEARMISGKYPAVRFAVPERIVKFEDQLMGSQSRNVARELGDFVIAKADGTAAYQLAVVVDDLEEGVTEVVRGADLIDSTYWQILLYAAMGKTDHLPTYTHLPLVIGTDGLRLAKRHGDTRLSMYRQMGVSAQRVLSLLARWCGIDGNINDAREMIKPFRLKDLSREPIVFSEQDDTYLRGSVV